MRCLAALLVVLLISCTGNNVFNESNDYWESEQLLNTDGLELYIFIPFTEDEMTTMSYDEKLKQRQIPENFLQNMTTKELFYQFVYTDLSKSVLMFNTTKQGFEAVTKQFNVLPELLNRADAGHVLLELLQKVDPSKLRNSDSFYWFHCLQIIIGQKKIISSMTDEEINDFVLQQLYCHDKIRSISNSNKNWEYPASVKELLFGLGNVMIQYEFDLFMQTLNRNPDTNEFIWDTQYMGEQDALQVINYAKQFKMEKK